MVIKNGLKYILVYTIDRPNKICLAKMFIQDGNKAMKNKKTCMCR